MIFSNVIVFVNERDENRSVTSFAFFVAIRRLGDIGSRPRQIQACASPSRGLHVSRLRPAPRGIGSCVSPG